MAVSRAANGNNGSAREDARERLFDRYSQNLCRNIIALAEVVQRKLMEACRDAGFDGLKLSYGQVIQLIEPQGTRIIDIARSSAISKQAIGQIANDLEQHGYIKRVEDDVDRRARKLQLTAHGIALVRAAGKALGSIENEACTVLGDRGWQDMMRASVNLFVGMRLIPPKAGQFVGADRAGVVDRSQINIATVFPALAVYVEERLMALLAQHGYRELKRSFSQVLGYLPPGGVRINDLADLHGVSKQAISQIVAAIEAQGFVCLIEDATDKRAKKILLTAHGESLLVDSVQAMTVVENDISAVLGAAEFNRWCDAVGQLYRSWCGSYRLNAMPESFVRDGSTRNESEFDLTTQVVTWLTALPVAQRERFVSRLDGGLYLREEIIESLRALRLPEQVTANFQKK